MGKYLILWKLDQSRIPVDPQARGAAWKLFIEMIKQDLATGPSKDWGAFVGESSGYAINEGTEVEIAATLQQYVPFVEYRVHPIASVSQVEELIQTLLEQ